MSTDEKELKTSTEVIPRSSGGGLFSPDDVFDEFLSRRWPRLTDWGFSGPLEKGFPKVDILDYENEIEVRAALPGINKDNLDVTINNRSLTIRASREEEKEEGKYFRREITRGEFQRTLSLPVNVDNEHATASFKEGILTVTIPKTEKSKHKTIEIQ
jgi:HSP20 family protein